MNSTTPGAPLCVNPDTQEPRHWLAACTITTCAPPAR